MFKVKAIWIYTYVDIVGGQVEELNDKNIKHTITKYDNPRTFIELQSSVSLVELPYGITASKDVEYIEEVNN